MPTFTLCSASLGFTEWKVFFCFFLKGDGDIQLNGGAEIKCFELEVQNI
jgi:hypothetical protein